MASFGKNYVDKLFKFRLSITYISLETIKDSIRTLIIGSSIPIIKYSNNEISLICYCSSLSYVRI